MKRLSRISIVCGGVLCATAVALAGGAHGSMARRRVRYRPVGCRPHSLSVVHRGGPSRKLVALSFDDGPSTYTRAFVKMLRAHDAVATFFVVGEEINASYRSILRTELRDGDAIGDHTWSHPYLPGNGDVVGQLRGTMNVIRAMTGYTPCVFRPPYGAYDSGVVRDAASLRLSTVLWNVDPTDWAQPGVSAIEQRVLSQVRPGSIILSHDGGGPRWQTLAAYPYIIDALRHEGYRFVTVPQLLGFPALYRPCITRCHGTSRAHPPRKAIVERGKAALKRRKAAVKGR